MKVIVLTRRGSDVCKFVYQLTNGKRHVIEITNHVGGRWSLNICVAEERASPLRYMGKEVISFQDYQLQKINDDVVATPSFPVPHQGPICCCDSEVVSIIVVNEEAGYSVGSRCDLWVLKKTCLYVIQDQSLRNRGRDWLFSLDRSTKRKVCNYRNIIAAGVIEYDEV